MVTIRFRPFSGSRADDQRVIEESVSVGIGALRSEIATSERVSRHLVDVSDGLGLMCVIEFRARPCEQFSSRHELAWLVAGVVPQGRAMVTGNGGIRELRLAPRMVEP